MSLLDLVPARNRTLVINLFAWTPRKHRTTPAALVDAVSEGLKRRMIHALNEAEAAGYEAILCVLQNHRDAAEAYAARVLYSKS